MARRNFLPFRIPFFRIFYSTTYTSLYFILLVLLAITPATLIFTAFQASAYQYTFMIGGAYALTAILTVFLYTSRLYTNRSILASVGKSWIPVEDGEVGGTVRKMIVRALERSAIIALETRPRDLAAAPSGEHTMGEEDWNEKVGDVAHKTTVGRLLPVDPRSPPWGHVEHPGWSSPSQIDTSVKPHIHYMTVIMELPNLIEARAVSLAPSIAQTASKKDFDTEAQIITQLQRPPLIGLREYVDHLMSLDLIELPDVVDDFLSLYEHARFSPGPVSEAEFKAVLAAFAAVLSGMRSASETGDDDIGAFSAMMPTQFEQQEAVVGQQEDSNPQIPPHDRVASTLQRPSSIGSVLMTERLSSHSSSSSLRSTQSVIRAPSRLRSGQLPYLDFRENG